MASLPVPQSSFYQGYQWPASNYNVAPWQDVWVNSGSPAVVPVQTEVSVADCSQSRAARRRRNRKSTTASLASVSTAASTGTPPSTPRRMPSGEVWQSPKCQSAADVLELLLGPSPKAAVTENQVPAHQACPPRRFPTGSLSLQDEGGVGPSATELGNCEEKSKEIIARLEAVGRDERAHLVQWLTKAAKPLSLTKFGTRIVQKALEVASCSDRDSLVAILEPHVEELCDSPHGNHVLSKIIEVMPSAALSFVVEKIAGKGPVVVAKHRFGCRVLERLIEHCDDVMIGAVVEEIVAKSRALCAHDFGNFVIQHLLEHWPSKRDTILQSMIPDLPMLAVNKSAAHVVQKAMDWCDEDSKKAIVVALLDGKSPHSLGEVACSRPGSYVVEQLQGISHRQSEVRQRIEERSEQLCQTQWGQKILECFGLPVPDAAPTNAKRK